MFDIKLVRENPDLIRKNIEKKRDREKLKWLDDLIKKDKKWRSSKYDLQELRHKKNSLTNEIRELKKNGKGFSSKIKKQKELSKKITELETDVISLKEKIEFYLDRLPNIMHKSVPKGKDESQNKVLKKWGKLPKFSFPIKNHVEIAENLDIADFDSSAATSGKGFYFLKGELAQLNQALIQFATDFMIKKGYLFIEPPMMIRGKVVNGVVAFDELDQMIYKIEGEDLSLIGTSEHSLIGMFAGQMVPEEKLPIKIVGYSVCFRKEIGSHGIDEKGLFRTHQFYKVEQIVLCKPENSWKYYDEILKNSEEILQALELPYQLLEMCSGDLGDLKARQIDPEVWMPNQKKYREIGSCSNITDFQSRRLNIKYGKEGGKKELVHTLNNTALATSRAMVAILENNQQKDGTVKVPKVLWPYMSGVKVIGKHTMHKKQ